MEKLKQLNKELQDIQSTLEEDRNFRLSEQLQNIIDEISNLVEARVSPESGGQLADKMLKANTRLILGDSTSEDEKFLLVNRKFLREYIAELQNMLDDIG